MKVVLAEKPSVARDLASHLKATARRNGYFEGAGYQVTWAFGHLVSLKEPDEYDATLKRWKIETLPFVPDKFLLKQTGDGHARKQFAVIRQLFQSASEIICATDAGREGELIFRYILEHTKCTQKRTMRLWLSSLTPSAIRQAFANLRPAHEYDNLYAAAKSRSEADWIVGLNATRCFTVLHGGRGMLWSAGRVQTPVLALIVRRDDEIRTFKPEPFWELQTRYRNTTFKCEKGRFKKEEQAAAAFQRVSGKPFIVTGVKRKEVRLQPPQLYDLTTLQRDMNRRYGMSADAVLKAAQSLYEKKLISYPRTDSRYLTNDMKSSIGGILKKLAPVMPAETAVLDLQALPFTGRIVNNSKVTDHHAIIPTGADPAKAGAHRRVFDAIHQRLLAAFYPVCIKEETTVQGIAAKVAFAAKGVRMVEPGWTALYPRSKKSRGKNEAEQPLPQFNTGESGPHKPAVHQGETSPPRPYDENSLLGAMETAGKLVDDEAMREALKERGLGTPATRASIIETLLHRGYIARQQKTLIATDAGRYLIAVIGEEALKSAELTGQWEAKLKQIESGRLQADAFMSQIAGYTERIVSSSQHRTVDTSKLGDCPRCGKPVIQGKRDLGCSGWKQGCSFILPRSYQDHQFSDDEIRQLLQRGALLTPIAASGQTPAVLTLTSSGKLLQLPVPTAKTMGRRKGKSFSSKTPGKRSPRRKPAGSSNAAGGKGSARKQRPAKQAESLGDCPLCDGEVCEQPKSFSCNNWREGCKFVVWKEIAGKRISKRTARTLVAKQETSKLKGFKTKSGREFEARLKLLEGEVKLHYDD